MSIPTTVLILTHLDRKTKEAKTPHIDWLKHYNPDVRIEVIYDSDEKDETFLERRVAWRNGDKKLRNWWKENGESIDSETIAIFEWDTLMKGKLPPLPDGLDLAGKTMFEKGQYWSWWRDDKKMSCESIGLVSFGAIFLKRWVLDAVSQDKWDEDYQKDIVCELRFPSAAKAEGAIVGVMDLPFVDWKAVQFGEAEGLYHGIKKEHELKLDF